MLLAYHVQKNLLNNLNIEDRGVKRARYAVLRSAAMPAILIEGGFMSNKSEAKKIYDPIYRRQMAHAITEAVVSYKKKVER
jgi:N-acetylmuramoyl-L-alanine amidase